MPCRGPDEDLRPNPNPRLIKERDQLTRLLCSVCRIYDHDKESWPEDVRKWWAKHQELDRAREEAREKREAAERKRRIAAARAVLKEEGVGLEE